MDTRVEVPPVEDWIVALRSVKRYTKIIDDSVDYLGSWGSRLGFHVVTVAVDQ